VRASLRRWGVWAARVALTAAITYFLFRSLKISWDELAEVEIAEWSPRFLPFVASFVLLLAVFAYLVALWARMVTAFGGPKLGLGEAIKIFFVANLGRYVPGKIWQLAGLTYLAGKRGVSLPVASAAAVLGQVYSLGAAAILAGIALAAGTRSSFPRDLAPWALGFALLIALLTTVPAAQRSFLRTVFKLSRREDAVPRLDAGFGIRWLALYLPAWLAYGIAFGLLWRSLATLPPVSWPAAVGGFAGAYFLGYAALFAPAGVGVREGVMALLLTPWMGAAEATLLAVLARLWMTAAELLPVVGIGGARALNLLRRDSGTRDHAT
jgi:hypothetical protein